MKKIVLAGGCFWGLEAYLDGLPGIEHVEVGYANGQLENPSYEAVKTGTTGHAEACYVTYNEDIISLPILLKKFWQVIDPTLINRQGPDIGHQYRTGVYYLEEEDRPVIQAFFEKEQQKLDKKIMTELAPLTSYYKAEDYHQKYLQKNPNGYCHIDLNTVSYELE